ncbi:MAG: hypothetical protein E4H02_04300 [Lentisphaerales bacterium]|jgi:ABC-2 type transport system permease protein|nr:MAG: hypothetical protein E4H02_04300 [Lentisphaerales bacterium]
MRNFLTLWRRELDGYFVSSAAYVMSVVVLAITGLGFWGQARLNCGEPLRLDILVFWLPTIWLMVMIVATVLTMRLFAEEKRSGTIEALMTAPVTDAEVVLGKYASALTVFAVTFLPTILYPLVLRRFSSGIGPIDGGALLSGYAMFVLMGAFYASVGLFMSAVSRSQIVAAVMSFAALCGIFLLPGVLDHAIGGSGVAILRFLSAFEHIQDSSRGIVDTRAIVLYISCTWFMLFATTKVLESRRWV